MVFFPATREHDHEGAYLHQVCRARDSVFEPSLPDASAPLQDERMICCWEKPNCAYQVCQLDVTDERLSLRKLAFGVV